MNWTRVGAVMLKTWHNSKRDVFRIFDIFWWPAFELFIWGIFSIFLSRTSTSGVNIVTLLLGAIILWTFFDRSSRDISISMIDELWSRNFVNLFSTPLSLAEYVAGVAIVAVIKLVVSMIFMFFLASVFYKFQIVSFGYYLVPAAVGLVIFGWALSLIVQGFIMRFGHTVEVFIWAIAILVQPLSCVFYPLSVLPGWASEVARALPTTYFFENMRSLMTAHTINGTQILLAYGLDALYLALALVFFYSSYRHAQKSGNLIKNY